MQENYNVGPRLLITESNNYLYFQTVKKCPIFHLIKLDIVKNLKHDFQGKRLFQKRKPI